MSAPFYRAFEDVHRGSRQDIMRRLQVYLPFVLPIAQAHPATVCLDLGCGRGEWLELLAEHGLQAQGVDLDAGMLQAAQTKGLHVRQTDALQALQGLPEASASVISAFHLAEHLQFEDLQVLVDHALRALVPGGLLILETPNPDNLQVATCNFYLDPSHIKPIPSLLLAFMAQQAGFARSKILGLQENPGLRFQQELQLQDVLAGASPDYAVVAQKVAPADSADDLVHLFARDYGISTASLAQAYSAQQKRALSEMRRQIHDLGLQLQQDREALQSQLQSEIHAIHDSALWRLSRPLQWLFNQIRRLRREGLSARLRALQRRLTGGASPVAPDAQSPARTEQPASIHSTSAVPSEPSAEHLQKLAARLQPETREGPQP